MYGSPNGGGGGSGRVALISGDKDAMLEACGKVADFLSGDRSKHKQKGLILCII